MERSTKRRRPVITGRVFDSSGAKGPIRLAEVCLLVQTDAGDWKEIDKTLTADDGSFRFFKGLEEGVTYQVATAPFGLKPDERDKTVKEVTIEPGCEACASFALDLRLTIVTRPEPNRSAEPLATGKVGKPSIIHVESAVQDAIMRTDWSGARGAGITEVSESDAQIAFTRSGRVVIGAWAVDSNQNSLGEHAQAYTEAAVGVTDPDIDMVGGRVGVALERTAVPPTLDQALWVAIRNRTRAISFGPYNDFIDRVMGSEEHEFLTDPRLERRVRELGTHLHGVGAYQLLKTATEVFLLLNCGVRIQNGRYEHHRLFNREEEEARLGEFVTLEFISGKLKEYLGTPPQLPYITRVVEAAFPEFERNGIFVDRVVSARFNEPCLIELPTRFCQPFHW